MEHKPPCEWLTRFPIKVDERENNVQSCCFNIQPPKPEDVCLFKPHFKLDQKSGLQHECGNLINYKPSEKNWNLNWLLSKGVITK